MADEFFDPASGAPMTLPDAPGDFTDAAPVVAPGKFDKKDPLEPLKDPIAYDDFGNPMTPQAADPFSPLSPSGAADNVERERLNYEEAKRNQLAGSSTVRRAKAQAALPTPGPDVPQEVIDAAGGFPFEYGGKTYIPPEEKKRSDDILEQTQADIIAYNALKPFSGFTQGGYALAGQFRGALTSPESLVNPTIKIGTAAWMATHPVMSSILGQGLGQAFVNTAVDPIVQANQVAAGLKKEYDFVDTLTAFPTGFAMGAGPPAAFHALSGLFKKGAESAGRWLHGDGGLAPEVKPPTMPGGSTVNVEPFHQGGGEGTITAIIGKDGQPTEFTRPEPPISQGFTRFYHEDKPGVVDGENVPFTTKPLEGTTSYVDLPENLADGLRAKGGGDEISLPRDIARQREELPTVSAPEDVAALREARIARQKEVDAAAAGGEKIAAEPDLEVGKSFTEFVREQGGLKPSPEVDAIYGRKRPDIIRKDGKTLDQMREAAVEAKYFRDTGVEAGGVATTTPNDVLNRLADEDRGVHHYPEGKGPPRRADVRMQQAEGDVYAQMQDWGHDPSAPGNREVFRNAANMVYRDGFSVEDAVEKSLMNASERQRARKYQPDELPFETRTKEAAAGSPAPKTPEEILREDFIGPRHPGTVAMMNLRGIMRQLAKAFGVEIRQGVKGARGVLGTLEGRLARLIDDGDLITFGHEIGHRVETEIGAPLTKLIDSSHNTMKAFAAGLDPNLDPKTIRHEGFGEFIATYISEREAAVRVDPDFVREFRNTLGATEKGQKILDTIDGAYMAYRAYQNAPGTQIASSLVSTREGAKAIKEIDPILRGPVQNWFYQRHKNLVNLQSPLNAMINHLLKDFKERTGRVFDLTPDKDPRVVTQVLRHGAHSRTAQEMHTGILDDKNFQTRSPAIVKTIERVVADPITGAPPPDAGTMAVRKRDFATYLLSVWHGELRKQMAAGLIDLRRPPTGMTDNTAATQVKAMEAKYPMFKALAEEVYAYNKALVKKEVDAGLRSAESYQEFMQPHNYKYVPTYRDMASPTGKSTGIGQAMRAGLEELNRRARTGSTRNIFDPVDSLMDRHFLINEQVNYNKAVLILRDFLRNVGGDEYGRFVTEIPNHKMRMQDIDVRRVIEKGLRDQGYNAMDARDLATMHLAELNMESKVRLFHAEEIKSGNRPIIFGMEGGERFAMELPNTDFGRDLFHAIDFLGTMGTQNVAQAAGLLHSVLVPTAKSLRAGAVTTFTFAVKNMIRDAFGSFIYINGVKAPFETILKGAWELGKNRLASTEFGKRYGITESDIVKMYRDLGGLEGGSVTTAMTQEGRGIGARKEAFGRHRFDVARAEREMAREAAGEVQTGLKAFTEALGDARRVFGDGLRSLAKVAEFSEVANRVGIFKVVYEQNRKMKRSEAFAAMDAAHKARDFVDFGMHGSNTELISQTIPFFNASVQGAAKFFKTLNQATFKEALTPFEQAEKSSLQKQLLWKVSSVAAFTMLLEYMYGDEDWYRRLPDQRKATYWNFKVLGQEVALPKPFEWASLLNLAENAMRYTNSSYDEQHILNWVKSLKYTFSFPSNFPIVATAMGLSSNYDDFFNRPIVPDRMRHLDPYLQRYNDTGKMYVALAYMLRGHEGVRDFIKNDIPLISPTIGAILASAWSPAEAEWMVSRMLGDWPRELGGIDGINKSLTTGDNRALEGVPVLRSILPQKINAGQPQREIINLTNQTDGRLTRAKTGYEYNRQNDPTGIAAQQYFDNLDDAQKQFVRLGFIEGGPVVNTMHPMVRSKQIYTAVARIGQQIESDTGLRSFATGKPIDVPIGDRRAIVNLLNEYTSNQATNALIYMNQPGYKNLPPTPTEPIWEKLRAISPVVAKELATELAERHVLPQAAVERYWPQVQDLITAGGNAKALSVQAKALGVAASAKGMEGGGIPVGRGAVSIEGDYVKKEKQKPTVVPATRGAMP